jgi:hypothetical protein
MLDRGRLKFEQKEPSKGVKLGFTRFRTPEELRRIRNEKNRKTDESDRRTLF